jgi:hypothetical protein
MGNCACHEGPHTTGQSATAPELSQLPQAAVNKRNARTIDLSATSGAHRAGPTAAALRKARVWGLEDAEVALAVFDDDIPKSPRAAEAKLITILDQSPAVPSISAQALPTPVAVRPVKVAGDIGAAEHSHDAWLMTTEESGHTNASQRSTEPAPWSWRRSVEA